jgi:hypothetical protein
MMKQVILCVAAIAAAASVAQTTPEITSRGWQAMRSQTNIGEPHPTSEACWRANRLHIQGTGQAANYRCVYTEAAALSPAVAAPPVDVPAAPAPAPSPAPATGYDVAAQVAAIRAHPGYGAQFAGLALPTPPRAECLRNEVRAASLAQFNAEASSSCKRITLAAGPHTGSVRISGQDIEAVFTGATVTPADGNDFALSVAPSARRIKVVGGDFNNAYGVGGYQRNPTTGQPERAYAQDVHIFGGTFTGLYTQGRAANHYGDGVVINAQRLLVERVRVRAANGGFFVEGGSSNVILANSDVVVPKLARHENPVRINGGDLIKHTWRMHAAYDGAGTPGGRIIVRNVQSEGGGAMGQYPGQEGPHSQSSLVVVQGWRYYRAPDVDGNNVASFPHRNDGAGSAFRGSVMNAAIWADDNTVFFNGQSGSIFGGNVPPGTVTRSVFVPYSATPVWAFR